MVKIAWLSDSPLISTGYSDSTKYILNELTTKYNYDCHALGHAYQGQTLFPPITFEDGRQLFFKVYGCGREGYFKDILQQRIKEIRPDIFGINLDSFMVYPWILGYDLSPAKTFFWYPSDGGAQLPQNCWNVLKRMDMAIAYSRFAQRQAKEVHGLDTEYCPLPVDTKYFFKMDDNERRIIRHKYGINETDFVVGNVYRNQGRKMADKMFRIFNLFAKNHQNVKLLIHADPNDPAAVFDTNSLIQRYNLENKVITTGMTWHKGFSYTQMNEIYNAMDVKLDTTSGEGFGITFIEAMAAEVPIITTDYTTAPEILVEGENPAGELVDYSELTGSWNVDRAVIDDFKCFLALEKLYYNEGLRKLYGRNGRKRAIEKYDIKVVTEQFKKLMDKLLNNY